MKDNFLINRQISTECAKSKKSILCLGPRQVGKSTLMASLHPDISINLAKEATYLAFSSNPNELEERMSALRSGTIFIDEVQRLPSLLNTIQALIDEHQERYRFLLTGSSARKLKRGNANLLPGRVHVYYLGSLTCEELQFHINIKEALAFGTLPGTITTKDENEKKLTLTSYAATYLKEEIQAEALTKNIEGFARYIYVVAAEVTHFLDFTKLASEAMISRQAAIRFFEILEDTLIIKRVESFSKSIRKRLIQHPRFFFFDVGVLNGLMNNFSVSADRIGMLFEHFIYNQLTEYFTSHHQAFRISSYRTEHGAEVDFILEYHDEIIAIEIKASKNVTAMDCRGLKNFKKYVGKNARLILLCLTDQKKIIEGVEIIPWQQFFSHINLKSKL